MDVDTPKYQKLGELERIYNKFTKNINIDTLLLRYANYEGRKLTNHWIIPTFESSFNYNTSYNHNNIEDKIAKMYLYKFKTSLKILFKCHKKQFSEWKKTYENIIKRYFGVFKIDNKIIKTDFY